MRRNRNVADTAAVPFFTLNKKKGATTDTKPILIFPQLTHTDSSTEQSILYILTPVSTRLEVSATVSNLQGEVTMWLGC
jgi:hypothetical protein